MSSWQRVARRRMLRCAGEPEPDLTGGITMALRNARPKRVALAVAALTTCFAAVAGAAWASSTPSAETQTTLDGKARFKGHYTAYSAGENHGGILVGGTLMDLDKTNHRSVKFQVRVEGYAYKVIGLPQTRISTFLI
jgi:hypothetical protein